jgi:hypothetical protein
VRRLSAGALAAFALAGAGCSAGTEPARVEPEPAPASTAYFVGAGADGIGASLDLLGDDPVVRLVDAALAERGGERGREASVGVVSVVNDGRFGTPVPRFIADLSSGGAVPLRDAADLLSTEDGPVARRALARLSALPRRIPAEGAATAYVVLEAAPAAEVASVRMVVARGAPVTLAARRR